MIRTRLKYFCIWFRFCRDIQIFKKLRGVLPTTETDSAVSNIPRSPQWAAPRGELHPVESSSAVCIPLRSQALQCASHHRVKWWTVFQKLCGVHPNAESITCQLSVLIQSFTNAISLWCLQVLTWNWYCNSQIVQGIFFTSEVFQNKWSRKM